MDLVTFKFNDIRLQEACWIDGKPFFTRRAIGEWLEAKNPGAYVRFIINRNPHIKMFSTRFKLNLVEGSKMVEREVEVYDPIGLQLIVFESRQPKAIAYKIAVANLVWEYMNGTLKPSKWSQRGDLVAAGRQIHSMGPCIKRGELMRDLAEREGCSLATIYRRIERASGRRMRETVRKDKGLKKAPIK